MEGKSSAPTDPSTALLLDFLQSGLDLGLSLSSLKVQVAAISAATQKKIGKSRSSSNFSEQLKRFGLQ